MDTFNQSSPSPLNWAFVLFFLFSYLDPPLTSIKMSLKIIDLSPCRVHIPGAIGPPRGGGKEHVVQFGRKAKMHIRIVKKKKKHVRWLWYSVDRHGIVFFLFLPPYMVCVPCLLMYVIKYCARQCVGPCILLIMHSNSLGWKRKKKNRNALNSR